MAVGKTRARERGWNSNIGVILAVAGSAVGFGNFLRFPGLAAQYGGGAFMIAYFTSLLLMGIPLAWVEWSVGRKGGSLGGHSTASIFMLLARSRLWKYLGLLGVAAPMGICMYYLFIESWTLNYAWKTMTGAMQLDSPHAFEQAFGSFVGINGNGDAFDPGKSDFLWFFALGFLANFWVMYRGVGKGIEWFCKWSLPVLLLTSLLILVRVLTLGTPDPSLPERNVNEGLGYMWDPAKVVLEVQNDAGDWKVRDMQAHSPEGPAAFEAERALALAEKGPDRVRVREISLLRGLMNPAVWLAAAGQIFWSLSVCFGSVATYASYVKKKEDIALSSLTAASANECVEVGVAGMMIVPAAVAILGVSAAAGSSVFGLGFNVLPQVFAAMPGGQVFGALFFGLLFLAAVTSSISLIQPSIAFLEEFWLLNRHQSIVIVGLLMFVGSLLIAWFSKGLIGLDTMDFWLGTMSLYMLGACFLYLFCVKWGVAEGYREISSGAKIKVPYGVMYIIRWVTPLILFAIIASWAYENIFGTVCTPIRNLLNGEPGAVVPLLWWGLAALFLAMVAKSSRRFHAKLGFPRKPPTRS